MVFYGNKVLYKKRFFNNQVVVGKNNLTDEDIEKENKQYLELGAKYFYIKQDEDPIGLIHFLPKNPHDNHTWIGLLIIHKEYQRNGLGSYALRLLENKLKGQDFDKVRLCVQNGNDNGAAFWNKNGFAKISTSTDGRKNQIDIYEKVLVYRMGASSSTS
jgi:ribosomal protein S18 acetylase RimI-like enzyme